MHSANPADRKIDRHRAERWALCLSAPQKARVLRNPWSRCGQVLASRIRSIALCGAEAHPARAAS